MITRVDDEILQTRAKLGIISWTSEGGKVEPNLESLVGPSKEGRIEPNLESLVGPAREGR